MSKGTVVFTAFVIAVAVFFIVLFAQMPSPRAELGSGSLFQTYTGLIVAMASGFFGATFSMLLQCRTRASEGSLEDVRAAASWTALTVRGAVGLGAAVILYFFFGSGLLEGSLWPDLGKLGLDAPGSTNTVPNQDWCLLIIWSFIAGFSETFVPNFLAQTETRSSTS